ncbi:MAG: PEP-CTERM sorting domain-containing protein [Chthoniobacteraceae bacterium]
MIDTTSYQDLLVSFDLTRSGTGPNGFTLQYSIDGSNFTNFTSLGSMPGTSWSGASATVTSTSYSFDLSSIDTLENLSAVYFRLTSDGLNSSSAAVATGGTARVDNFLVSGTATAAPEPSSVALATLAGAGAMMIRRRRRYCLSWANNSNIHLHGRGVLRRSPLPFFL